MTSFVRRAAALVGGVVLVAAGCGGGGEKTSATAPTTAPSGVRTVRIEMRDIAFSPNRVEVRAGETVRFVFHNAGKIRHDAFIGDEAAQEQHEMEMRAQGNAMMGAPHGGEAENAITLEPGETGELTYTFRAGEHVLIGCHQPGHYAAGMKVTIEVTD